MKHSATNCVAGMENPFMYHLLSGNLIQTVEVQ